MQVVILAGGAGSRVGPITEFRVPKALMQINNKSVLEHQVMSLPTGAKVLLLIGDGKFKGQFESESEKLFSKYRVPIDIVSEGKSLGTGGALIAARENLDKKFIVLMGDILFSEDLNKFWNFMKFESSSIGILVRRTDHPEDSDLAKLNEYGDVIRIEKYPHRSHINFDRTYGLTGIFYIRKKLVSNTKPSMKIDLTKFLAEQFELGERVRAFHTTGIIRDVGTVKRFSQALKLSETIEQIRSYPRFNLIIVDKDDTLVVDQNPKFSSLELKMNKQLIQKIKRKHKNHKIIVVSNQPGIAKGDFSKFDVQNQFKKVNSKLQEIGFHVDEFLFCPHHPDSGFNGEVKSLKGPCYCRKPLPGLVIEYLTRSLFVVESMHVYGDSFRDRLLARNLGGIYNYISISKGFRDLSNHFIEYLRYLKILKNAKSQQKPKKI